jgi:dihydropteroate synthase
MHWRALSHEMNGHAVYRDVVADGATELGQRAGEAQIVLDPGLGFAKRPEHDWTLLAHLGELRSLGFPLLVGASRKSFPGAMLDGDGAAALPAASRDTASAAVSALATAAGASCVRVHDVAASLDAVRVAEAWGEGAGHAIPGGVPGP